MTQLCEVKAKGESLRPVFEGISLLTPTYQKSQVLRYCQKLCTKDSGELRSGW